MSAPRIDQVNVVVGDVNAAAQFLIGLGMDLPAAPPAWDAHHRTIPTAPSLHGGDDLFEPAFGIDLDSSTFAEHWGGLPPSFSGVVVNLRVDERSEVDGLYELALSIGGRSLKEPYDAFWGSRFALVGGPALWPSASRVAPTLHTEALHPIRPPSADRHGAGRSLNRRSGTGSCPSASEVLGDTQRTRKSPASRQAAHGSRCDAQRGRSRSGTLAGSRHPNLIRRSPRTSSWRSPSSSQLSAA